MKRVLVTGGSGWIGRHVTAQLQGKGFDVHATYRSRLIPNTSLACHWHQVDLLDEAAVASLIRSVQPTHLIHLAWEAVPPQCYRSITNYHWVHASMALIQRFVESGGTDIVVAGSCAEYEWENGYLAEQSTSLSNKTPYAVCKNTLRTWLQSYAEYVDLRVCWARIFHLYGPHESGKRFISNIITSLLKKEEVLCTHGRQSRDFLYIEDAAAALVSLVMSKLDGIVNIGSGRPVPLRLIASIIQEQMGSRASIHWGAIPLPADEPLFVGANIERLQKEAHWKSAYTLHTGLAETIAWWRHHVEEQR
ncbi:NAD(P)-dependent oxidoreductase [Paenibacillus sp. SC116]|uniref:NAD-dependent epimerase/dehydratase family protein n=1 Tax=Paenibacillus sp. SC116 TaxID=2968986 RepID=UPI00215AF93A|nr:NAD(P)-dependent oxidoreductase [Paenibacillus sp. SC116]MCR8844265.1 NAD(P)-dependent oxidoreductase [Paenibacillus sp. SC116]